MSEAAPAPRKLSEMEKARLVYALLEADPGLPQELRWGLADYTHALLEREREDQEEERQGRLL